MVIVYCETCGKRVPPDDIDAGRAQQIGENLWTCGGCSTKNPILAQAPAARPKTGTAPTASTVRRAQHAHAGHGEAKAVKTSTATQFMLGAAAAAVILGVLIFALSGKKNTETAAVDKDTPKPAPAIDAKQPITPPQDAAIKIPESTKAPSKQDPAKSTQTGSKVGGEANALATPSNAMTAMPAVAAITPGATVVDRAKQMDKEMEDYRVHRAERMLEEMKTWFKQNPNDPYTFQSRLKEVAGPYGSTPAGVEARKLLDEMKSLPPPPDRLDAAAPESKEYKLVYDLNLAQLGHDIHYDVDNRAAITQTFDRIAYFIELTPNSGETQYIYVSMDAFTAEIDKIGIPAIATNARFQMNVANMNVFSNVGGVVTGNGIAGGNIEFWPNNYGPFNAMNIPGATTEKFDFGDAMSDPPDGYGCMQVHNHDQKQTLFAINHWVAGGTADLGIGNAANGNPDWTFATNSGSYRSKRLRVLVHPK